MFHRCSERGRSLYRNFTSLLSVGHQSKTPPMVVGRGRIRFHRLSPHTLRLPIPLSLSSPVPLSRMSFSPVQYCFDTSSQTPTPRIIATLPRLQRRFSRLESFLAYSGVVCHQHVLFIRNLLLIIKEIKHLIYRRKK